MEKENNGEGRTKRQPEGPAIRCTVSKVLRSGVSVTVLSSVGETYTFGDLSFEMKINCIRFLCLHNT